MVESHDEVTIRSTKWDLSVSAMDFVNATPLNQSEDGAAMPELDLAYTICEILVAVCAVVGNALVILVFHRERRLRRRTNYYIVSLATADFLVGLLGIPFAILASVGLPHNLYACLFTVSLLVVLCTISIFCLVAVSVDRYWAILHPMGYSRNVRTKTAIGIIGVCWASGTLVGFLPLFGWYEVKKEYANERLECYFTKVMDYNYLVFLYFATIIAPALLLAAFYAHIYQVVVKQLRQIVTMNPTGGGGTMLRVLGAAQKREVKATKNLSIIVLFFIVCWFPLYTINCVQAFCHECSIPSWLMNCCIILSHLNSAGNPLLYAYHLRDFRAALKNLLCCLFIAKDKNGAISEFQGGRSLHHGLGTPSRNNSSQSLHHHQALRVHHPHNLADSPSFASSKTFPNTANSLSTITSSMNSIAALSVGTVQLGDSSSQAPRKKMWTLTEVSSNCEDDQHLEEVQRRSETRRGSAGQVNSAYIEDGSVPLDLDYEDGDDEVFLPDGEDCDNAKKVPRPLQLRTSMSISKLSDMKSRTCITDSGKTSECEDTAKLRDRLSLRAVDELAEASLRILGGVPEDSVLVTVVKRRKTTVSSSDIREESNCPDNPSPPEKLLLVEAEINNREIDSVDDKIELSPSSGGKMFPIIVRSNSCNGKNSDRALAESELPRTSASSPTGGSLKLSPLKIVGGFLFHSSSVMRKPNRLREDVTKNNGSSVNDSGIPEQMEIKANGLQRHSNVTLVDTV